MVLGILFVKGSGNFSEGLKISYSELSSVFLGASAQSAQYLEDIGLTDGESEEGCKYSDQDGLVYFCGFIKSAKDYSPLEGITVAVYEELAPGPSLLEPEGGLYSPNGKYGGNLIHLFTSTVTNAQGHYEITARQGRNIHVAFLCGNEFVGGLKRIEDISRIEIMNDLISCPVRGYAEPPPQLSYADRDGFLECVVNFTGSFVDGAEDDAEHFVPTVGASGNPNLLVNSRIFVSNFDFRFVSFAQMLESLNITAGLFTNSFEAAFDIDWYDGHNERWWGGQNYLRSGESGGAAGDAGWIGMYNHGAWRQQDCRATYAFPFNGVTVPGVQPCSPDQMSLVLSQIEGLPQDENLYLILNQLPFMPPWPSTLAFARLDIRDSIRQIVKDSAQEVRQGDALWDNYIGTVPRVYQKDPNMEVGAEGEPVEGEGEGEGEGESLNFNQRMSEKSTGDSIISCEDLALEMADIENRYKSSSLAGLSSPFEMEADVVENAYFTEWEYDIPVCRDGGSDKTLREVCLDEVGFGENRLLCRAAMWTVKASGGTVTPYRSQEDKDSPEREETIRQSIYNPKSNAANDGSNEDVGTAWANQEWEINHGSYSNVANFNYTAGGFLTGTGYEGKNYLNFYGNPSGPAVSDDSLEAPSDEVEVQSVGFGQTPTGGLGSASPNAIKANVVIQDVGTNNIAQCSVSTMLETVKFQLTDGLINTFNPSATEAPEDANNKKLELLDLDVRTELDKVITKSVWSVLSNFFIGNPLHATDTVVGSGTFYTGDSVRRDDLLRRRSSPGAFALITGQFAGNRVKQGMRDFFDSLRTIASPNQEIDFSTIAGGTAADAFVSLYGLEPGSWGGISDAIAMAQAAVGFFQGNQPPTKSYAHRKLYDVTNKNLPLAVSYGFWENTEARTDDQDPFRTAFPVPTAPWFPDNWGNEPSYPWNTVSEGHYCSTYVDEIARYKSDGVTEQFTPSQLAAYNDDEDANVRYDINTLGLSRTCRVKKCEVWEMTIICDQEGEGNPLEGGIPPHSEEGPVRDCNAEERYICAIERQDTDRLQSAKDKAKCGLDRYRCDSDNDGLKDDWCEDYPEYDVLEIPDCDMERAGPYSAIGQVSYNIANKITQDSKAPDREAVTPVDGLKAVSDDVAKSFYNPSKTNLYIENEFIKEVDIAHSKSADPDGIVTQGYPMKSIGGVNQAIFDPGSHPYVTPYKIEDNPITYHCEELGVPVDGNLNSCLDNENPDINCWKCPIAPLPKCTGLFGEVDGIDEIVISPKGEEGIRMNFDFNAFEEMLPIYVQVEEETGVPCEVLAALHFREGSNQPGASILDGKALRGGSELEDARIAADHLLSKKSCTPGVCGTLCGTSRVPGGLAIKNLTDLKQMIAYWGGGGNDNCNPEIADLTEYDDLHGCPASYGCGDYDSYVMSNASSQHDDYSIIWPMDKIDVTNPSLFAQLEAMFPGSIGGGGSGGDPAFGGVRSDAACWIIQNAPESLGRSYNAVGALCPPPIPELRPGALAMAKYIYEISVGLRAP